MKPFIYVIP